MQDYPWIGREEQYIKEQRAAGNIGTNEHDTGLGVIRFIVLGVIRFIVLIVIVLGCIKLTAHTNEGTHDRQTSQAK